MAAMTLKRWRKRNGLTQVEAAALLRVSQPYLSLLEKGVRPLTDILRARMKTAHRSHAEASRDDDFRAQLSGLGYSGFAHVAPVRLKSGPDDLLLSILSAPDMDARVVEALPWFVREYADSMDMNWLVRQAKLRDLQNRLGFVLQVVDIETPAIVSAVRELERARLLEEATLCWDSMPAATREWMRANRTALARHWNVLTRMRSEEVPNAA